MGRVPGSLAPARACIDMSMRWARSAYVQISNRISAFRIRGAFNDDMPRISSQFNSAKSLLSSRLQGPSLYQGAMRYPSGLVGIFVNTGSSPINCRIPDWLIRRLDNGGSIEDRLIILGV